MGQLDLNGFFDLVYSTTASIILGVIIMTLISIDSEKPFGNLRWQVNYKSYILQYFNLLDISKIINNLFKKLSILYFKILNFYILNNKFKK